ncbi:hypothetical protein FGW37_05485 [Streptomyces rectiverticillatus]|uniref:hypothetical protein n=1 Tax=Streptomyces rectiverticillatus TaxID=173860 RepID=UPI0015C3DEAA|nr:hypothetical protein [Streptomyces rectiverticillatus]QLE71128.1 hypothetical protein FGW37_05485 [Streptomyces rectiverticillatus]
MIGKIINMDQVRWDESRETVHLLSIKDQHRGMVVRMHAPDSVKGENWYSYWNDPETDRYIWVASQEDAQSARFCLLEYVTKGMRKPYTVVRSWDDDWWDSAARQSGDGADEAQVFHVWAHSADDASDEADELALALFGRRVAGYLRTVVILHGHAPEVEE